MSTTPGEVAVDNLYGVKQHSQAPDLHALFKHVFDEIEAAGITYPEMIRERILRHIDDYKSRSLEVLTLVNLRLYTQRQHLVEHCFSRPHTEARFYDVDLVGYVQLRAYLVSLLLELMADQPRFLLDSITLEYRNHQGLQWMEVGVAWAIPMLQLHIKPS